MDQERRLRLKGLDVIVKEVEHIPLTDQFEAMLETMRQDYIAVFGESCPRNKHLPNLERRKNIPTTVVSLKEFSILSAIRGGSAGALLVGLTFFPLMDISVKLYLSSGNRWAVFALSAYSALVPMVSGIYGGIKRI